MIRKCKTPIVRAGCVVLPLVWLSACLAQDPPTPSDVANGARAAGESGTPQDVFTFCISFLESTSSDSWQRDSLRAVLEEVKRHIDSSLKAMSASEQKAALASIQPAPQKPPAKLAMAYASWLAGNRAQAINEAISMVKQHPDSMVSEFLIAGIFYSIYYDLDRGGSAATCKWLTSVAPNNPATGWALFRFTFWYCSTHRITLAKNMNTLVMKDQPNTKVAEVAADLNTLIEDIQEVRFEHALALLEKMKEYLYESVALDIVDTFLIGPEWHDTSSPGTKRRLAEVERVFGDLVNNEHPVKRDFGLAVLARRYQLEGKSEQALALYQRVLDGHNRALEGFCLRETARICRATDPQRALAALKRFHSGYGKSVGGEIGVLELADVHLSQGNYEKALERYQWVETERTHGRILPTHITVQPRRGMMLCLKAMNRDSEAAALADQLLRECGAGKQVSEIGNVQLSVMIDALKVMGRAEEATAHETELSRRLTLR